MVSPPYLYFYIYIQLGAVPQKLSFVHRVEAGAEGRKRPNLLLVSCNQKEGGLGGGAKFSQAILEQPLI